MNSALIFSISGLSSAVFLLDVDAVQLGDRSVCPGSFSPVHGSCDLGATFVDSCDKVKEEIMARVQGESGWTDPHNGGKYTDLGEKNGVSQLKRLTGDHLFIDHINFGYKATADGGCYVAACSDSSSISAPDGLVGFCNIWDLYCNSADDCKVVHNDLKLTTAETMGFCPNAKKSKCLTQVSAPKLIKNNGNCPGSPAQDYESCAMTVTFPESCATVKEEMEARLAGENNWVDPHNKGSYSIVKDEAASMQVKRASGKNDGRGGGRYMDLMNFDLTDTANGGCMLVSCSDSQEKSNNDQSTNYCNIRNLYSGKPIKHDLSDFTEAIDNKQCPRHDRNKCN